MASTSTTAAPREVDGTHADAAASAVPSTRVLTRIVLVMVSWTAVMWSILGAFVARDLPGGWLAIAAGATLAAAPIIALVRGLHDDAYPSAFTRVFVLRPFWYAQVATFVLALSGIVGLVVGLPLGAPMAGGRLAILVVAPLVLTFFIVGYWGSRRLVVREVTFTFDELPPAFDGLRIAQVSDLHVGPHTPRRHLARIVRAIEQARADLIVTTGDQVDDFDRDVHHFNHAFAHLRAPLGFYAIAGNHDIYAGWDGVHRGMSDAGIRVLVNDSTPLRRDGQEIWLAGTGDPAASQRSWGGGAAHAAPDVARTLADVPEGAFVLALAHNPALWPALAERGVHLTLSGHTHHGQISIPALNWCLASPFLEHAMGAYEQGHARLYINPGTNFWGIPLRLGAWPEVTLVCLRKSKEPSEIQPPAPR